MYIPPFTISTNAINLIAEISAQIERYAIRLSRTEMQFEKTHWPIPKVHSKA